ncbi:TVP38/TMEM64 family protein [Rhodopirellula baltica]|uniref:TVP38/TMEM64 family membrane protein n=1 Tax=Rhodopirellula baltica SWK14 TaxID=993516 RepID=L7CBK4_RHOBT|nr:VTT domain-containing protein [Rhodopirellula baltica]ELP31012.1 membrane protein containing SNARE domain protein [Rhodopirellula baltica SWK14]
MRRWLILVLVVALLATLWYFSGASMHHETIAENEKWIRSLIDDHPILSIAAATSIYILTSLIPGTTGKSILYGWLFGLWIGLAIVSLSLTIAACIALLSVRLMFRDWALRKVPRLVRKIESALNVGGQATCLLTLRLLHAPYTGVNYSAGATNVRITTFAWTTLIGMIPSNVVFVLAGSRLPSVDRLGQLDLWTVVDWKILLVSSVVIAIPLSITHSSRRFRETGEDTSPVEGSSR